VAELTALAPVEGEEDELAAARSDMQKGERLSGDLAELGHMFSGSDSGVAQLRAAARKLDRIAGEHALLEEALAALDRALVEASEAEERIERAVEELAHDPRELDRIETRLFDLRAAARKHSCAVDDLPEKMRGMRADLDAIEAGEEGLAALEKAAHEHGLEYRALAEALSVARIEAAARLDVAVKGNSRR
jgi:DNA repair protein RecN (Recombination protein N)